MTNKRKIKTILVFLTFCVTSIIMLSFNNIFKVSNADSDIIFPSSLWTVTDSVKVTENVDVMDGAKEGYIKKNGTYIYKEQADLAEWEKNGVLFEINNAFETVEYKNVINVDGFTVNNHLIDVLPVSSNPIRAYDFAEMNIKFTDYDDESNWFNVKFYTSSRTVFLPNNYFSVISHAQVSTSTGVTSAYRYGKRGDVSNLHPDKFMEFGVGAFHNATHPHAASENGVQIEQMLIMPYSLRYDEEDKSIWVLNEYQEYACILDMDDTNITSNGNEWYGFKNNRVKISISVNQITNAPAKFFVLNVGDNGMNGESFVDTLSPEYFESKEALNIPVANVNIPYKTFEVQFYDFADGFVTPEIFYQEPNSSEFVLIDSEDGSFVPQKEGTYTLRYVATDSSGNKTIKDYSLIVNYAASPISIEVSPTKTSYSVGEIIDLPTAELSGGSGDVSLEIQVIRLSDNKVIARNVKSISLNFAGEYLVNYTATDYLGRTATRTITYNVLANNYAIYETELQMYKQFTDGVTVVLPRPNAFDYYTEVGQKINACASIVATGTGNKSNVSETLDGYVFTPSKEKFGDRVILTYKTYCKAFPENVLETTFEVPIVEIKYVWDYLLYDESKLDLTYNEKNADVHFVGFTTKENVTKASVSFANPIWADGFEFQFVFDEGQANFKSFDLTLTDTFNARKKITFTISYYSDTNFAVTYNGKTAYASGGFFGTSPLLLSYVNGKLIDYRKNVLFDLSSFSGFDSNLVWAEITLNEITAQSTIKLNKLGSQLFAITYDGKGNPRNFRDSLLPDITIQGEIDTYVSVNSLVKIPKAIAYDLYTPYIHATYKLVTPSGKEITGDATVEGSFLANEYGCYELTYTAKDNAKLTYNLSYQIFVNDNFSPQIDYKGDAIIGCKVGETLKFDNVKIYDSVDKNCELCVFVIKDQVVFNDVTQTMSFKFDKAGTYILRYYAYDSSYNYQILDVKIYVNEVE